MEHYLLPDDVSGLLGLGRPKPGSVPVPAPRAPLCSSHYAWLEANHRTFPVLKEVFSLTGLQRHPTI